MAAPSGAFVLSVVCLVNAVMSATLPGVTVTLSQAALQTAANVAIDELVADIQGQSIPDQHGDGAHHLHYDITSTRITSFTRPSSSLVVNPGQGITWSLAGAGISAHGDWRYKIKKGFVKISDHGSFDASVSSVSLTVSIHMDVDSNGRPTISTRSCSCSVGSSDVKFHGGASWIYNMFRHFVEHKIEDKLKSLMCDSVNKAINVEAANSLAKMKVQVRVGSYFMLDYRLVSSPIFGSNFVESMHKGQFQWAEAPSEAPFQPRTMSVPAGPQKMVQICLSDYVVNTLAYVAHTHGMLNYTLTKRDLSKNDSSYLDTTCDRGTCIGSFLPQIGKVYPNGSVEMAMHTTSSPTINTTSSGINGTLKGQIIFNVRLPDGTLKHAFTSELEAEIPITAGMTDNRATAHFKSIKFRLLNTSSDVGPIPEIVQNFMLKFAADKFIVPQLNGLGQTGFDLPGIDHAKFVDPELVMLEGASCFATDVTYDPTMKFEPGIESKSEPKFRHNDNAGGWDRLRTY